jgi:SAM-dependent methyltransferase
MIMPGMEGTLAGDDRAIHPLARTGFGLAAAEYERSRPGYPAAAVEWLAARLGITDSSTVLDVGAGTGKLTRAVVPTGAKVLALEPVEAMRQHLAAALPDVEILDRGTAEEVPLPDGSVDAVVCAQAFHWFRGAEALAEFHRVLREGGGLGLLWNNRDESMGWVAELTRIIDPYESGVPRERYGLWRRAFDETTFFGPIERAEFRHEQSGDVGWVLDRVGSMSFIASLPAETREDVFGQIRRLLETHPNTAGREEVTLPYRTEVFACRRLDRGP